ncbi:Unknown protein sequence [Pseudomonas amygdali pv. lachrymans]|nr:Unknown protein sequence [Pseudomonas amygdali pv. lachrymans]
MSGGLNHLSVVFGQHKQLVAMCLDIGHCCDLLILHTLRLLLSLSVEIQRLLNLYLLRKQIRTALSSCSFGGSFRSFQLALSFLARIHQRLLVAFKLGQGLPVLALRFSFLNGDHWVINREIELKTARGLCLLVVDGLVDVLRAAGLIGPIKRGQGFIAGEGAVAKRAVSRISRLAADHQCQNGQGMLHKQNPLEVTVTVIVESQCSKNAVLVGTF